MAKSNEDFFVAHLPAPSALVKFSLMAAAVLLVTGLAFSFWVSSAQQSAGHGHWQVGSTATLEGVVSLDPYPILHTTGEQAQSVMLLLQGKRAATSLVEAWVGQPVKITGIPIGRGHWLSLELRDSTDIVAIDGSKSSPQTMHPSPPASESLQTVQLSGEIVDSKCFIGVMKPGAGKVHRACAALCVSGGIPPMLVVTQRNGDRFGYVLVDENGGPAADVVVNSIAVPVEVSGQLERRGDLTYLRIASNGVRRI